jgi:sugar phosphate isomerase/epimerase
MNVKKQPTQQQSSDLARTTRRDLLAQGLALAAGAAVSAPREIRAQAADGAEARERRMKICLTPGSIGVTADQNEAITLAHQYGFDAVEPMGGFLARLENGQIDELAADLKAKGLVWGAAGLPVDFRRDDASFNSGMKELPKIAAALQRAGANRVGTYIMPGHNDLTYLQNLRQHAERLREAARVLGDHGQRLGFEYVGTATLRARFKYPFVHSMAETLELIAEIGVDNLGVVPDTWHWWQAGDTTDDLLALTNEQVISADLNDAPAGLPKDQQQDGRRELPGATGVIDAATFLSSLTQIGYDGPIRCEPFNEALNKLENDAACEAVISAMRKSFEAVR